MKRICNTRSAALKSDNVLWVSADWFRMAEPYLLRNSLCRITIIAFELPSVLPGDSVYLQRFGQDHPFWMASVHAISNRLQGKESPQPVWEIWVRDIRFIGERVNIE